MTGLNEQSSSQDTNLAQQFAIQRSKNSEVDLAIWFQEQTGHKISGNSSIQASDSGRRVFDEEGNAWTIYKTGNERLLMKGLNLHSTPPTRTEEHGTQESVSGTCAELIGFSDHYAPFQSEAKDIFEIKIQNTKVFDQPIVIFNELFDGQKAVTLDILKKVRFFEIDGFKPDKHSNDLRKNFAVEFGNTYLVLKDIHRNILFSLRGWTVDTFIKAIQIIHVDTEVDDASVPVDVTPVESLMERCGDVKPSLLSYMFDVMSFSWFWKK